MMFHRGSARAGGAGGPETVYPQHTDGTIEAPRRKLRTDSFVQEVYWLGSEQEHKLGEGAFSEVVWARHLASGSDVACKKMQLPAVEDSNYQLYTQEVFKEIDILCSLQHENLLSLIEYFVQVSAPRAFRGRGLEHLLTSDLGGSRGGRSALVPLPALLLILTPPSRDHGFFLPTHPPYPLPF